MNSRTHQVGVNAWRYRKGGKDDRNDKRFWKMEKPYERDADDNIVFPRGTKSFATTSRWSYTPR